MDDREADRTDEDRDRGHRGVRAGLRPPPRPARHDVTLFEADDRPGATPTPSAWTCPTAPSTSTPGSSSTTSATIRASSHLFDDLGVATKPSDMSFGVRDEVTGLEWKGTSFDTVFAQRRNLARPAFLRMLARHRPVQPQGPGPAGRPARRHPLPRRPAGRRPVVVPVPRLVPDPHGLVDLVGRPVDVPRHARRHLRPVLRQPRPARVRQPARLAHRRRAAPSGTSTPSSPRSGRAVRLDEPVTKITRTTDEVELHTAPGPSASTTSWWPPTATRPSTCCRTPARSSGTCSAPSATRPTGPRSTPTCRLLPANRRAWASWNYHRLADHPAEPPSPTACAPSRASTRRRAADHPQPGRRHRPGHGPAHVRLRPSRLRRRRHRRPARHEELNGVSAPGTAAPTGATASTRTASRAPGWCAADWRARTCDRAPAPRRCPHSAPGCRPGPAQRHLRGTGGPPPVHPGRPPLHLPDRHGLPRPVRGTDAVCAPPPAVEHRGPQRRHVPPRRLPGRPGRAPRRRRAGPGGGAAPASGRPGPSACSPSCARGAGCSTRSPPTTATTPTGTEVETTVVEVTNTPWHERTAYVLAGTGVHRVAKGMHVSPFLPMGLTHRFTIGEPGDGSRSPSTTSTATTWSSPRPWPSSGPGGPRRPGPPAVAVPPHDAAGVARHLPAGPRPPGQGRTLPSASGRTVGDGVVGAASRRTGALAMAELPMGWIGPKAGTPVATRFLQSHGVPPAGWHARSSSTTPGPTGSAAGVPEVTMTVHDPSSTGTRCARARSASAGTTRTACGTATTSPP